MYIRIITLLPVSYTHLDVYKRQAESISFKAADGVRITMKDKHVPVPTTVQTGDTTNSRFYSILLGMSAGSLFAFLKRRKDSDSNEQ